MKTLRLSENWDLMTDDGGNIVTTDGDYAVAQTAANKIRLFVNDAYFNRTDGIPHFDIELGKPYRVSEAVLTNRIRQAAMGVEGVTDARVVLENNAEGRYIGGNVFITTREGTVAVEI